LTNSDHRRYSLSNPVCDSTLRVPIALTSTKIALATRVGTPIDNEQVHTLGAFETNQMQDYERKYGGRCRPRGNPTGLYNCHGMVFASRRTGITDPNEIKKIIREDGYKEIAVANVLPGDIVLYFDPEKGEYTHSAVVLEEPLKSELNIPLVVSKWGKYREVVHMANVGPYPFEHVQYFRITE
jgi:hypothetical protein